jgi:cell division protein FtsL
MLRFVNICLVLGLVALAYVIYQVKYEARALDAEIASLGRQIDEERDALAVLRAEWSLLNRPERIERLAKKYLKLAPAQSRQLVTLDKVTDRDFDRARLEAAPAPAPAPSTQKTRSAGKSPASVAAAAAADLSADASASWPPATVVVAPIQASAQ